MKSFNSEERYQELAEKWLNNTITSEEKQEFARYYSDGQDDDVNLPVSFAADELELEDRIYSVIHRSTSESIRQRSGWTQKWYAAAAVLIAILGTSLYFYSAKPEINKIAAKPKQLKLQQSNSKHLSSKQSQLKQSDPQLFNDKLSDNVKPSAKEKEIALTSEAYDIEPGNDKAILILGNGSKIVLDDSRDGILATYKGVSISKTAEGEIIYTFSKKSPNLFWEADNEANFNTIQTPKGGRFLVTLIDGSKVWLNAASSLRFPIAFTKDKRQVELTGEAYFEVAPDKVKIFEVITNNQTVEVLGTHFNINAYTDEPSVNTTLLEGSVRISDLRSNRSRLLLPGQQAKLGERIEIATIENVDLAIAWKNGYFVFDGVDISTVMRQIERWYDVSVRYEGAFPANHRFGGEIEKNLTLKQVLKILEKTKVHFRLEGREVVVMM